MKKTNTIATLVFHVNRRISLWVHARRLEAERAEAKLARSIEASLESDPRDATLGHDRSEMTAVDLRSLDRRRRWVEFKELCREIAEHPRFNTFFLFLICLNTATMAVEHHGMDDTLAFGSVVANACFTAFFFLEVSVKVLARGVALLRDAFNRFDFLIVSSRRGDGRGLATGGYDPSGMNDDDSNDDSTTRPRCAGEVLRAFACSKTGTSRFQRIGEVLLSSLSSFTSIAGLVSVHGRVHPRFARVRGTNTDPANHFVYGVDDPSLGGRAGFDTFYHSLLAVFQVLTLEDWEFIMFKSVTYAGWSASVFFVSWVIVGKYTFLTLFLAVTMEAFESKYDAHAGEEARAVAELVKTKRARRRRRFAELRRRKKEKERRRLHLLEKQTTDGDDTGETGGKLALTTVSVTGGERLPETF